MRTGKITIGGKDYITCLSTRVLVALEERGGTPTRSLPASCRAGSWETFWLLAQMIDAGDRYAKLEGLDNPGSLTLDAIMDCMGPDDYEAMTGAMAETVKAGPRPRWRPSPARAAEKTPRPDRRKGNAGLVSMVRPPGGAHPPGGP